MTPAAAGASDSIVAALRSATQEAHAALDARLGAVTTERYGNFLQASHAVLVELEPRLACWHGAPADGVSRVAALRADLAGLGVPPAAPAAIPVLASLAEAMGALYVVEGSALGGVFMARSLAPELPRRYLTLRGDRTRDAWRAVVAKLEAWHLHAAPPARVVACQAARDTFAAYEAAFEATGAFAP